MFQMTVQTPTGAVTLTEEDGFITRVEWGGEEADHTELLSRAAAQMLAYFDDPTMTFDLPLRVGRSDFQRSVCDAMLSIPVGDTRTYGDIARDLDVPAQAVGQACGGNPIPIIIPCHRVLGASGLGGFSGRGGVETKVFLLKHEGAAGLLI